MKTIRFRLGMMCYLDESYYPNIVSDIDVEDEEAKDLEKIMNENKEVVLMGRYPGTMIYENQGSLDKADLGM